MVAGLQNAQPRTQDCRVPDKDALTRFYLDSAAPACSVKFTNHAMVALH